MQFLAGWIAVEIAIIAIAYATGHHQGESKGQREALSTNPVSEQLEMTCAGLWVGEQNRKYQERQNGKQ